MPTPPQNNQTAAVNPQQTPPPAATAPVPVTHDDTFGADFSDVYSNAQKQQAVEWGNQFLDNAAASMGNTAKPDAPSGQNGAPAMPPQPAPDSGAQTGDIGNVAAADKALTNFAGKAQNLPDRIAFGAARDMTLGAMQAPRSIIRGVANGANSILDFVHHALDLQPQLTFLDEKGTSGDMPKIVTTGEYVKRLNLERAAKGEKPIDMSLQAPVPDAPRTDTVTGHLIEGIAQFVTGFKGVDKLAKVGALGETVGSFLQGSGAISTAAKGALGDLLAFDEHQQRLSNIVQQYPKLQNPVTDFLQSKPDDSFAEGKLKQAIEGMGVGLAGDALFRGIGLLKKGLAAKATLQADAQGAASGAGASAADAAPGVGAKDFSFLGDPENDALLLKKQKLDAAAAEVQGAFGKTKQIPPAPSAPIDDYQINFSRINTPDDIQQLMDELVNKPELKVSIDAARRGAQSNADTQAAADSLDGFDSLMQRRSGQAFNAEQIVAARKVYNDTSTKLKEAAQLAAAPNAGPLDQFNFRKMLATHHAVQKEFMGIRAEAGRALQAWSIPVGLTPRENLQALQDTLTNFGGAGESQDLAARIASIPDLNSAQLNTIAQKSALARTGDALSEAWTLGLLTNPTTHVVNLASNTITSLMQASERFAMAGFADSPVTFREGLEFTRGMVESFKLAAKNAAQAFQTGQSGFGVGKVELPMARATSREILDPEGKAGVISKAIDWYGGILSKYAGGALAASDEFSKTVMYQAQLRALITRQGITQGLSGNDLSAFIARALQNPDGLLQGNARDFAQYATFTRRLGETGQNVQAIIARNPALKLVAPFLRTPANIFKFTFERTPLAYLNSGIRADISAGGLRRAQALTRIGMGSTIMMAGADMALQGQVSGAGPADGQAQAALRRTGWQPYSLKVGDKWYSFARFEPVATIMGMSADMADIISNYEAYDMPAQQDIDNLVTAAVMAVGNQAVGKTFLKGFADMAQMLGDPQRYGQQLLQTYAGSAVPAGAAAVARAVDPNMKQVMGMMDAIKARIPGMSQSVPPRRNIWGEEIKYFYPDDSFIKSTPERMLSLINPVYYSKDGGAPLDDWMLHNGFNINMPQKVQQFDGVRIDLRQYPQLYDRLVYLRGQGVKLPQYGGQTMKQFFDSLANDKDPFGRNVQFFMQLGNDYDTQQNFISKVVNDYQAAAKDQVLHENSKLISGLVSSGRQNAALLEAVRKPIQQQQSTGGQKQ